MKKLITLMSVALGVGSMAVANDYTQQFRTREIAPSRANSAATVKADAKAYGPMRVAAEEYGTLTSILFEDFSLMKAGAEGEPDGMDLFDPNLSDIKGNVWQSMMPGYTHTKDWGCHNVFQAGGMIYMQSEPEERNEIGMLIKEGQQSQINPTLIDNTAYDPFVVIRFDARAENAEVPGQLLIEAAETNGMGPSWDIFDSVGAYVDTEEWRTYTAILPGGGKTIIASVVSVGGSVYLDNLEILGLTEFVGTPVPTGHTNYLGTSFTVNWLAAHDAEGYRLTVTTYNEETGVYDKVIDHKDVGNVTSYTIENVISGQDYYYSVEAYKGSYTSIASQEVEIHDIERPAPLGQAEFDTKTGKMFVSWPEVPAAERYNYKYYYDRTAQQDGEFVIWDEDFSGLVDFDGEPGIVEFEEIGHIDGAYGGPYYVNGLNMGAWEAYSYYCGNGFLGICSFYLTHNGQPSQFESPALDLSKDGGKFKFSLDLRSHDGRWPEKGILPGTHDMPQAIIAIAHYDETVGDYVTTAQYYTRGKTAYDQDEIDGIKFYYLNDRAVYDKWKHYELECEGGTENTKIIIFAYEGIDYLAIDNIKLTQNYKAGETFRHPIDFCQWIDDAEVEITVPDYVRTGSEVEIYHQLEAVKARVIPGGMGGDQLIFTNSGFGDLSLAGKTTFVNPAGVENVAADVDARVYVSNGVLYVLGTDEAVSVYAINGAQVAAANGELRVALGQRGVYVVKVGDKAVKVVY